MLTVVSEEPVMTIFKVERYFDSGDDSDCSFLGYDVVQFDGYQYFWKCLSSALKLKTVLVGFSQNMVNVYLIKI